MDDSAYKKIDIQRALAPLGTFEIDWSRSLEDAENKIRQADDHPYCLIVTDMNFPKAKGEAAYYRSGELLVDWMKEEGRDTPVILCSTVRCKIPGTAACIWYSGLRDLDADFREALRKLS